MTTDAVILCVGLNPALDVTYGVDTFVHGEAQRVRSVTTTAGGKAANVCRVLTALGTPAHLVAPVGGLAGEEYQALLRATDISHTVIHLTAETRRSVAVVENDGTTSVLNEPGHEVTTVDWAQVRDVVTVLLSDGVLGRRIGALVLSGSVPPGMPGDAIAQLTRAGRAHGIPVLVDTSGSQLAAALREAPSLVKPNSDELREATGLTGLAGAKALAAQHPTTVIAASAGPDGLCIVDADGLLLEARPEAELTGNPTGAGDAAVAALAIGLLQGHPWTQSARLAVGASAAAVLEPVAGVVDPERVAQLAGAAHVHDRSGPRSRAASLSSAHLTAIVPSTPRTESAPQENP